MIKLSGWQSALATFMLGVSATSASAATQSYIELQAGLGYSTNPLLTTVDNGGSGYGRVSAYAYHRWSSERSATNVSAYIENNSYFRQYSNKQAFSLSANTNLQTSESVRLFGDIGFSGDFGGQLSSRFFGVPAGTLATDTSLLTSPIIIVDPSLISYGQRQYRLTSRVGASVKMSARDKLTTSFGAQRLFLGGGLKGLDYSQFDGTVSYDRQINERLTLGGRLVGQYADYSAGRSVSSIGPQATIQARLGPSLVAMAGVGFVVTRQDSGVAGSDSSINLALDGSLCRNLDNERMCVRIARQTQSSVLGGAPTSTSASLEYYRRLTSKDQLQLSGTAVRSGALRASFLNKRSSFYTLAASYDRQVNDRLSAGVNGAVRKLTAVGPDPRTDVGGSVFLRYRFGDIR